MRNTLILTASLLLLPALATFAAPAGRSPGAKAPSAPLPPVKVPSGAAVVSVRVDPKPASTRKVRGGTIVSWRAMVVVNRGSHLVALAQQNAANAGAQPGITHVETMQTNVSAGHPSQVQFDTWGPRPGVEAKIVQTYDTDPQAPAQDAPGDARGAKDKAPAKEPPAAKQPPATKQPAPPPQKGPAPGRSPAPAPTPGQKPSRR